MTLSFRDFFAVRDSKIQIHPTGGGFRIGGGSKPPPYIRIGRVASPEATETLSAGRRGRRPLHIFGHSAFSHDTLTFFRMAEMAPFSNLDTWAWLMPRVAATSIWVLPS